jgi:hypothetical protein
MVDWIWAWLLHYFVVDEVDLVLRENAFDDLGVQVGELVVACVEMPRKRQRAHPGERVVEFLLFAGTELMDVLPPGNRESDAVVNCRHTADTVCLRIAAIAVRVKRMWTAVQFLHLNSP